MMHAQAREFVERAVRGKRFGSVLEFGSLDINGSVRELFDTDAYHGVDLVDGRGVDEVADASLYTPAEPVDCVVCCEVLEHTLGAEGIMRAAWRALRPGGMLIVTCAATPREPHSAVDGGPLRDDEFYANVDPWLLQADCIHLGFSILDTRYDRNRGDFYMRAGRPT